MEMHATDMSNGDLLEILCGSVGRNLTRRPLSEVFGICAPRQRSILAGEDREPYVIHPQIAAAKELYVRAIQEDMNVSGISLSSPNTVSSYLSGRIGNYEHEVFLCLWMDARNRLIVAEELFRGTLTQTSVYPREVVKRALFHNVAAVIFAHNHPSGDVNPSLADKQVTATIKHAGILMQIELLDHVIVTFDSHYSFRDNNML